MEVPNQQKWSPVHRFLLRQTRESGQTVVFGVNPPSGVNQRHSPQNAMQAKEDLL